EQGRQRPARPARQGAGRRVGVAALRTGRVGGHRRRAGRRLAADPRQQGPAGHPARLGPRRQHQGGGGGGRRSRDGLRRLQRQEDRRAHRAGRRLRAAVRRAGRLPAVGADPAGDRPVAEAPAGGAAPRPDRERRQHRPERLPGADLPPGRDGPRGGPDAARPL
ncbi:MAG: hypothetical protein AVDCRST_MAG16-2186, partial [uncultured Frankineae bacterium]